MFLHKGLKGEYGFKKKKQTEYTTGEKNGKG